MLSFQEREFVWAKIMQEFKQKVGSSYTNYKYLANDIIPVMIVNRWDISETVDWALENSKDYALVGDAKQEAEEAYRLLCLQKFPDFKYKVPSDLFSDEWFDLMRRFHRISSFFSGKEIKREELNNWRKECESFCKDFIELRTKSVIRLMQNNRRWEVPTRKE